MMKPHFYFRELSDGHIFALLDVGHRAVCTAAPNRHVRAEFHRTSQTYTVRRSFQVHFTTALRFGRTIFGSGQERDGVYLWGVLLN